MLFYSDGWWLKTQIWGAQVNVIEAMPFLDVNDAALWRLLSILLTFISSPSSRQTLLVRWPLLSKIGVNRFRSGC